MKKSLFAVAGMLAIVSLSVSALEKSPEKSSDGVPRYEGLAFGAFLTNQYTLGEWSDHAMATLGVGADVEYTFPSSGKLNFGLSGHLDYAHIFPKSDGNLSRGDDVSFGVGAWLRIPFLLGSANFAFQPEVGYALTLLNAEGQNGSDVSGWYPHQTLVLSPAVRWIPKTESRAFELDVSPVYTLSFESENALNQLGFRLGGVWHLKGASNVPKEEQKSVEGTLGINKNVQNDFTPDSDSENDTVVMNPKFASLTQPVQKWQVTIYDPAGHVFRKIKGKGDIPKEIVWDGYGDKGDLVFSHATYKATLTATLSKEDQKTLGVKTAKASADIKTGTILVKIAENRWGIFIQIQSLVFDANAATFNNITPQQKVEVEKAFNGVVKKTKSIDNYHVKVEGYANNVSNTKKEQNEELIPLSQARADAIAKILVQKGLEKSRVSAVGRGGEKPIAKWKDKENWWKNRRIEFVITR